MSKKWMAFCEKAGEITDATLGKAAVWGEYAALRRKIAKNEQKLNRAFAQLGMLAYRQMKDYDTNLLKYPKDYAAKVDAIDALRRERKLLLTRYENEFGRPYGKARPDKSARSAALPRQPEPPRPETPPPAADPAETAAPITTVPIPQELPREELPPREPSVHESPDGNAMAADLDLPGAR